MDIEKLNKSQIVLLTLLVSFITSIATGIVTVSLMDQAPPTVTQTINRVVERTVERVVPEETQTATVITKERTVVVKESELIAQAVARVSPATVELYTKSTVEEGKNVFVARGVVSAPGIIVSVLPNAKGDDEYTVRLNDGTIVFAKVSIASPKDGIAVLMFSDSKDKPIDPASFVTSLPKLGQTIVALTGTSRIKVANGIVTAFEEAASVETGSSNESKGNEPASDSQFETSISGGALVPGSVIINTDGAVLGVATGNNAGRIIPATTVLSALQADTKNEGNTTQSGTSSNVQ